ncbi:MAG TPA: LON peptidase substrate-binding domain-containing protein [Methylomirabilota bacterium]|jgi:Lon protease-like protein|nr:LON peptidase substrate-binding domain-containing protein [Methylomirabilota bacterium]
MSAGTTVVPIFPLPEVTFFPHTLLPLHVFEARYRAMVMDALGRDRRLCVVKLRPGYESTYAGKPPVHAVAGVGEIVSWERLANGRYNILVRGDARVRLDRELPTDTLYRVVSATVLPDSAPRGDVAAFLERIRVASRALLAALERPADLLDTALAEGQPSGVVADRIAAAVIPDATLRQQILETLDVDARVAQVAEAVETVVRELRGGRS